MSKTYRQYDSKWAKLGYPHGADNMANSGCGATACADIVVNNPKFAHITPKHTRNYMVNHGYAIPNAGTSWNGISECLKRYGFKVKYHDKMATVWEEMAKGNHYGVVLFRGGTRGGVTWTSCGHYLAFTGYKKQNGKHYLYMRDPGPRKHDGWYCYETTMAGLIPAIWTCTLATAKPTVTKAQPAKKKTVVPERRAEFIKSLQDIGHVAEKKCIYSNSQSATTWKKCINGNKRINCARYVSFALQDIKVLSLGKCVYWKNGKLRGSGADQLKKSDKVRRATPNKSVRTMAKNGTLLVGDVCMFSQGNHTMVVGKIDRKTGDVWWYTAGGSDIKAKNVTLRKRNEYQSRKVSYLIRVK